ncbi:MAG TPA: hypothetical protein VGD17_14880 [Chitinophagaceae bacterium]
MDQPNRRGKIPGDSKEKNLRERSSGAGNPFDNENTPEPVSFEDTETRTLIDDEDIDRGKSNQSRPNENEEIKDKKQ